MHRLSDQGACFIDVLGEEITLFGGFFFLEERRVMAKSSNMALMPACRSNPRPSVF